MVLVSARFAPHLTPSRSISYNNAYDIVGSVCLQYLSQLAPFSHSNLRPLTVRAQYSDYQLASIHTAMATDQNGVDGDNIYRLYGRKEDKTIFVKLALVKLHRLQKSTYETPCVMIHVSDGSGMEIYCIDIIIVQIGSPGWSAGIYGTRNSTPDTGWL